MTVQRILVVDANMPWARSLYGAMPTSVEVGFLRIYNPQGVRTAVGGWYNLFSRRHIAPNVWEKYLLIPGWGRFGKLATRLVARGVRRYVGPHTAVCYTIPHYHAVMPRVPGVQKVYHAFDPYNFYDWPVAQTTVNENAALDSSDLALAVSAALADDFRKRTHTPVYHLPNAVAESFCQAAANSPPRPSDLPTGAPIVGCTGQINRSYDWDLINALAEALPSVTFVFIGNIQESDPLLRRRIEATCARTNVKWLGPRDHATLPSYIASFDICLNPLAVTPHNDRRSPLRLFDYLSTSRPIVSTAIQEAYGHVPHVDIAKDAADCAALIRAILAGQRQPDIIARRAYIARNTWSFRAMQLLAILDGRPTKEST